MEMLDPDNEIVRLCAAGMAAEAQGNARQARSLFEQAWSLQSNSVEACVAAHYVARHQDTPEDTLRWNEEALARANEAEVERVASFLPSLYLNLAHSHEVLGDLALASDLYERAGAHASTLADDRYGDIVRQGIADGRRRIASARTGDP
jgi:tetratricopeptide (TPR) repeat protein